MPAMNPNDFFNFSDQGITLKELGDRSPERLLQIAICVAAKTWKFPDDAIAAMFELLAADLRGADLMRLLLDKEWTPAANDEDLEDRERLWESFARKIPNVCRVTAESKKVLRNRKSDLDRASFLCLYQTEGIVDILYAAFMLRSQPIVQLGDSVLAFFSSLINTTVGDSAALLKHLAARKSQRALILEAGDYTLDRSLLVKQSVAIFAQPGAAVRISLQGNLVFAGSCELNGLDVESADGTTLVFAADEGANRNIAHVLLRGVRFDKVCLLFSRVCCINVVGFRIRNSPVAMTVRDCSTLFVNSYKNCPRSNKSLMEGCILGIRFYNLSAGHIRKTVFNNCGTILDCQDNFSVLTVYNNVQVNHCQFLGQCNGQCRINAELKHVVGATPLPADVRVRKLQQADARVHKRQPAAAQTLSPASLVDAKMYTEALETAMQQHEAQTQQQARAKQLHQRKLVDEINRQLLEITATVQSHAEECRAEGERDGERLWADMREASEHRKRQRMHEGLWQQYVEQRVWTLPLPEASEADLQPDARASPWLEASEADLQPDARASPWLEDPDWCAEA